MMKALVLFIVALALTGCLAEYENVSHDKEYANLVAEKYKTLGILKIQGATLDQNYKVIDRYIVTEPPGIGGREILARKDLQIGSIIQIKEVMRCTNCLPPNISFVIEIVSSQLSPNIPIWLDDLSVTDDKGSALMNPKLFLKIE